jgi:cytoskeletal protein RodZ
MSKQKITLGYILKKYRSKSQLDIDRLSHKISTEVDYIIALEKGNYKVFTSFNQALPIIKKLSYVLGLKYQSLVDLYNKEYEFYINNNHKDNSKPTLVINYNIFKFGAGIIISFIIIGYIFLQVYQIRYSPVINLENKQLYQVYNKDEYSLTGNISRANYLTLNGQKVTIKEDGDFEVLLNLRKGENRIELAVQKDNKLLKTIQKTIYRQ